MKCFVGIDLGSTTTKALYLDENDEILGRGITNSRSNYELACRIARQEAEINSRFMLLKNEAKKHATLGDRAESLVNWLECKFKLGQFLEKLEALKEKSRKIVKKTFEKEETEDYLDAVETIFERMEKTAPTLFEPGKIVQSDFFRDIAGSQFLDYSEDLARGSSLSVDKFTTIFDKAISYVEGKSFAGDFTSYMEFAGGEVIDMKQFSDHRDEILELTDKVKDVEFEIENTIGTGYGRQTLPFPKRQIRSEILCHGLGAHFIFPGTRTVLDIGGQDTKAIQVDENGIVTSFQMNDRCAAGCGRYLGYIANEMNIGVHELGPIASKSERRVKISSTCTVFAGNELRERLSVGENREDILAGMHRAMMLRAMSLLARSGGVRDEFTFTGGVAKNEAAVTELKNLVRENYGDLTINTSPDSIYCGALGAALFSKRDEDIENVELEDLKGKAI